MGGCMIRTDRSRCEEYERCPRARYLHYEKDGGVERVSQSVPLILGSLIHEPLSRILEPGRVDPIEAIIEEAKQKYLATVGERGLFLDYFDGSDAMAGKVVDPTAWQVEEQLSLLEGIVLAWVKVRLPKILDEYDVLMVEKECPFQLSPDILFMTRADAVLRRKATHELFVLNFKSTSDANSTWREQWRLDQQTLSEVLGVEAVMGERVAGVLIEGLVKGRRNVQWPRESGNWYHNSPLIWCWKNAGAAPFPSSYATSYEYEDAATGKTHRLGKGWERALVVREMGIKAWLEQLEAQSPELLAQQFISLPPILRSDYEIECWKKATIAQEGQIAGNSLMVMGETNLDSLFPMHTSHGNCLRPGKCQFFDLCHGVGDMEDPLQFRKRKPNHPQESGIIQGGV